MSGLDRLYLVITGASAARRAPEIVHALTQLGIPVLVLLTEGAKSIVSPWEITLALKDGDGAVVESYFDKALAPSGTPGLVVIAPCTFSSLNKLAAGIADSLALSIASEAIGRGWPVLVGVSMNAGLWAHPSCQRSVETLSSWGVEFIPPSMGDGARLGTVEAMVAAVRCRLEHG